MNGTFFIWKGAFPEPKEFLEEINKKHQTIKFDKEYSKFKIQFLNVFLYKDNTKYLETTICRKPAVISYRMKNKWLKNESND